MICQLKASLGFAPNHDVNGTNHLLRVFDYLSEPAYNTLNDQDFPHQVWGLNNSTRLFNLIM